MKKKLKMSHKQKARLARKMLTQEEIKNHTPIFLSENWEKRKLSKAKK